MAGMKGRSGGRRLGSGARKKEDIEHMRELMKARVSDTVWLGLIGTLVKRARQGDVQAFRELRLMRFGHIPLPPEPAKDERQPVQSYQVHVPCTRPHSDEEKGSI